ncbi:hypothetical protein AM571_PC01713 (plasmid) [Rhizobium etli 8C-3]|uniref:Uncharacterized protein n=1 Tax=Rhizobium etli 8C-3 TaxID=538025 RepID=A0A1L5PGX1_RHIET|nr:hypothetical protein AM571_PC01713 [Rhizobium etli 8C-3]
MQHRQFLPETAAGSSTCRDRFAVSARGSAAVLRKPAACCAKPANDLPPCPYTGRSISRILPLLRGGCSVQEQFSLEPILGRQ